MDAYAVLKYPLTTESAMKKIEDNNTLVGGRLRLRLCGAGRLQGDGVSSFENNNTLVSARLKMRCEG